VLSPEILNRLPSVVFWVVMGVFVVGFVLSRLAEGSKAAADMIGPLGRWLRRRAGDRKREWQREVREAVDAPDYKALQRRIDTLEKLVKKLEAEIRKLELVEEANSAHQDMISEYLREDAQWHIDAAMMAVENSFTLPPHRSYTRFTRDYREKQGLEYGRRWTDDPEQDRREE